MWVPCILWGHGRDGPRPASQRQRPNASVPGLASTLGRGRKPDEQISCLKQDIAAAVA